ncbi:unnamed protein product [Rotaria sp. Silwood1]|nr:unnamed protein product [Rotaria sp. Silwood1]CAF1312715.1 unnamed protein product [Rotaria sp. Silwood1]CAF3524512.1 unnamed protein product [Rotaria sp. Silwood1]CAF3571160.1 unnamed protein product [Rotaria sp. Silwood1]CAF4519359.1 unnamed protein product [Rotaria sp. Silwood1]
MVDQNKGVKHIYRLVSQIKNIGPTSNAPYKFIVESTPFDDESEPSSSDECIITGRILPNSDLFKHGSLRVQIVLGAQFPFKPPKVFVKHPMYHPNIEKNGEVCTNLLVNDAAWTPTTTLLQVIEDVTNIIDKPSTDQIKHPEAGHLFDTDKKQYERIALEMFNKHCLPRN